MSLIEELKWRGMIQDITPGIESQLSKEMTSGYIGFDPTSDSLHIGSLVPILLLIHLQNAGHKPVALVGGATGMVGDPSGKSEERNLLSKEVLKYNLECIKRQLEKYLKFDSGLPNSAELVNNYDWFSEMRFLDFIRDVGKHITVNYMLSKESVNKRLEGFYGMSFTEFTYQLVQGYDFYWLYQNKNCKLQMGGSDQWGNITTGTELIKTIAGGQAFAFTCPLLTKADGGKFGKTEKGNIWLDPAKTPPYEFYQFWLKASDADVEKWIKIFTFLTRKEIETLTEQHKQNLGARLLQKTLAREITILVHGDVAFKEALNKTESLFSNQSSTDNSLNAGEIVNQLLGGVAELPISKSRFDQGIDIVSLLAESGSFASKGDARKMIQQGGVSINGNKIDDISWLVTDLDLLFDKYLLVQKGKKSVSLIKAINILEEFGANPGDTSLLNCKKHGDASILLITDRQLGLVFTISGIWEEGTLDWDIRDSANKATYFAFTYLATGRLTFYLNVIATSLDGKTSDDKWIRFEPSFAKSDEYNNQKEMAYVNEVKRDNTFETSTVEIQQAFAETFGQGGWVFNKVHLIRVRGQGKIKKMILGK
jgi:tyrosyl-tRNA synthetase